VPLGRIRYGHTQCAIGGDGPGEEFRDASAIVQKVSLAQWPNGHWTATRDPLAANSGGFAAAGRIWSVGGASPVAGITDLTLSRRP
jgi:hypothetical protein